MRYCPLPHAFRRLTRPSSPVIAKASTTCTSSLDPITLDPPRRLRVQKDPAIGELACATRTVLTTRYASMQSHNCAAHRLDALHTSSTLLKNEPQTRAAFATQQEVRQSDDPRTSAARIDLSYLSSRNLVELVGIEPTTYGLQSRRSPS